MTDGTPVSKRPWLRFTLRELILATLVVGLALALFLHTHQPRFVPTDFYVKLQSGDLLREVVKSKLQGINATSGGFGTSAGPRTRSADGTIYFPGTSNQPVIGTISDVIREHFEQSLRESGCAIHGRGRIGDGWQFHYDFRGGSGVVHALVGRSDDLGVENDAMIHLVVIEFAEPNY